MKTLIFDSNNQVSHRVLIFSPTDLIKYIYLDKLVFNLYEKLKIRDFETLSCTEILHKTSLFDLYEKHPWYFEEIKKTAEKENFVSSITYVCELIINHKNHSHFPCSTKALEKDIKEGKIKADYYDKFGEIEAVGNLFLNYFKLHLNKDSFVCFWNLFVNSNSSFGNKIKKMLIDFKKANEEH